MNAKELRAALEGVSDEMPVVVLVEADEGHDVDYELYEASREWGVVGQGEDEVFCLDGRYRHQTAFPAKPPPPPPREPVTIYVDALRGKDGNWGSFDAPIQTHAEFRRRCEEYGVRALVDAVPCFLVGDWGAA